MSDSQNVTNYPLWPYWMGFAVDITRLPPFYRTSGAMSICDDDESTTDWPGWRDGYVD